MLLKKSSSLHNQSFGKKSGIISNKIFSEIRIHIIAVQNVFDNLNNFKFNLF